MKEQSNIICIYQAIAQPTIYLEIFNKNENDFFRTNDCIDYHDRCCFVNHFDTLQNQMCDNASFRNAVILSLFITKQIEWKNISLVCMIQKKTHSIFLKLRMNQLKTKRKMRKSHENEKFCCFSELFYSFQWFIDWCCISLLWFEILLENDSKLDFEWYQLFLWFHFRLCYTSTLWLTSNIVNNFIL